MHQIKPLELSLIGSRIDSHLSISDNRQPLLMHWVPVMLIQWLLFHSIHLNLGHFLVWSLQHENTIRCPNSKAIQWIRNIGAVDICPSLFFSAFLVLFSRRIWKKFTTLIHTYTHPSISSSRELLISECIFGVISLWRFYLAASYG